MFGLAENDNNQTDVGACCCLFDYCDMAMFMVSGEQVRTWGESDKDNKRESRFSLHKRIRAALSGQNITGI